METVRFHTRDLKPSADGVMLRAFLSTAPVPRTLTLRAAAQNFENVKNWWFGAFNGEGVLRAVATMEGKFVTMYGAEHEATKAIAQAMYRQASGRPGRDGHTHHLFGPLDTLDSFWETFRSLPRTVVGDKVRKLMCCTAAAGDPGTTRVAVATANDMRFLFEFTADLAVDQGTPDPRRTARQAHEKHCQDLIASGRQLIGFDAGKPSMICELVALGTDSVLLDSLYVPRPFRRPAVIARLLSAAARIALQKAPNIYVFCDAGDDPYASGATTAGFQPVADYRHIMLRGQ